MIPGSGDAERVSEAAVIRYWLATEREKTGEDTDLGGTSTRAALDELLGRKPGAAAFLWRARPIEWSRFTLSRAELERLRHIGGPDGLLWSALSPDGTILGAAERLANEDADALATETGVDIDRILEFAAALDAGEALDPLVLTKRRGDAPPRVADGNHRATAVALHWLETGEYRPQMAYLGVGVNPVVEPLRRRLAGVLARFRAGPRW